MRKQTTNWSKRGAILTLSALILCASGLLWGESPADGFLELDMDLHLDKEPVREEVGLELQKTGWTYDCMECHASLKANCYLGDQLMEHRDLELKHGNNRFCLNCRHPVKLVFENGSMAPHQFAHPEIDGESFKLYVHPQLKHNAEMLAQAVAYFIPVMNYGSLINDGHCLVY